MREANRTGSHTVVIAGDDEMNRGEVVLRDMTSGEQKHVSFEDLLQTLQPPKEE